MSFRERIEECTSHDPSGFVPFAIAGASIGKVRRDRLELLASWDDLLEVRADRVVLREGGVHDGRPEREGDAAHEVHASRGASACEARSLRFAQLAERLADDGHVPALTGERYAVARRFGTQPFFLAERATIPFFGLRAHGVHLHGVVRRGDERLLWIARRARDRTTYPGMLDNMVAGGQPAGLSVRDNLLKECHEEAGIPADLARRALPTGAVHYRVDVASGMRDDVLFLFELELPEDFVPRNTDGEVESFELLPVSEVMDLVATTRRFKFNCNLALIDYFVRHGDIGPEHDDYLELVRGLHGHPPDAR